MDATMMKGVGFLFGSLGSTGKTFLAKSMSVATLSDRLIANALFPWNSKSKDNCLSADGNAGYRPGDNNPWFKSKGGFVEDFSQVSRSVSEVEDVRSVDWLGYVSVFNGSILDQRLRLSDLISEGMHCYRVAGLAGSDEELVFFVFLKYDDATKSDYTIHCVSWHIMDTGKFGFEAMPMLEVEGRSDVPTSFVCIERDDNIGSVNLTTYRAWCQEAAAVCSRVRSYIATCQTKNIGESMDLWIRARFSPFLCDLPAMIDSNATSASRTLASLKQELEAAVSFNIKKLSTGQAIGFSVKPPEDSLDLWATWLQDIFSPNGLSKVVNLNGTKEEIAFRDEKTGMLNPEFLPERYMLQQVELGQNWNELAVEAMVYDKPYENSLEDNLAIFFYNLLLALRVVLENLQSTRPLMNAHALSSKAKSVKTGFEFLDPASGSRIWHGSPIDVVTTHVRGLFWLDSATPFATGFEGRALPQGVSSELIRWRARNIYGGGILTYAPSTIANPLLANIGERDRHLWFDESLFNGRVYCSFQPSKMDKRVTWPDVDSVELTGREGTVRGVEILKRFETTQPGSQVEAEKWPTDSRPAQSVNAIWISHRESIPGRGPVTLVALVDPLTNEVYVNTNLFVESLTVTPVDRR